ncbi:MAG: AAA family ATPase [Gammaproteobacteria bacterium]|nr:AAA family ATPase [Gammaproteobacteria bacterium]
MYLYHYGFRKLPFSLTPDTDLFCSLPSHKEALNTIHFALSTGESFCKITGEVGTGKTMLCRWLMNQIGQQRTVAYIPNPVLSPKELKLSLAHELGLRVSSKTPNEQIIPRIQKRLIELNKKQGPVILIIDEAQCLPDESIETLRLFTNLETETTKLLQIVLFGQPELDEKLSKRSLRQLRQRIAFSHQLKKLNLSESKAYVSHRLAKAINKREGRVNCQQAVDITWASFVFLYMSSGGVPRLLNILCHKALMLCFGRGNKKVSVFDIVKAINDTEETRISWRRKKLFTIAMSLSVVSSSSLAWWLSS